MIGAVEHKLFVADGLDNEESGDDKKDKSDITGKFFLRFLLRTQVEDNTVLAVYRGFRAGLACPPPVRCDAP